MATDDTARISADEVLRIAKLAHLDLSAHEVERMARDLGQIRETCGERAVEELGQVALDPGIE